MNIGFLISAYSKSKVEFAGEVGFDCLEVYVEKGSPLDIESSTDNKLNNVMNIFRANKVEIGTIACGVNHLDPDPNKRRENNRYFKKVIKECKKFGTCIVATNAGGDKSKTPEENLAIYSEVFNEYAKVAEEAGVKIAIENCPHSFGYPIQIGNIAYSPEMWDALFEIVPSKAIGLEFDPSHFYWLGIDYIKAIKDHGNRIYAFHAKDTEIIKDMLDKCGIYGKQFGKSSKWDLGWWRYRIPGWGSLDWLGIFRSLYDINYSGPIIIEHENPVFGGERTNEGLKFGLKFLKQFIL